MNKTIIKLAIAVIALFAVAFVGSNWLVGDNQSVNLESVNFGSGTRFPNGLSADSTSPSAGEVRGTTLTITGTSTISGVVTALESTVAATATSTLEVSQSGSTFLISGGGGNVFTLPAVTNAGVFYRFQVNGAIASGNAIIDSAEGDNIEGSLIVAGAVVDCDAEDQLNFVSDGENIGDYVEVLSDGTQWLIIDSGVLTSAKLTCTDPS